MKKLLTSIVALLLLGSVAVPNFAQAFTQTSRATVAQQTDACAGVTIKKIGYSALTMESDFFQQFVKGLTQAAEKCGVEVVVDDPKNDAAKQVTGIENLVTAKVDVIAVTAVDGKSLGAAIDAAKEANIPVIALFGTFDGAVLNLGPNDIEIGLLTGRPAGEMLVEKKPDVEKYKVAFLNNDSLGQVLLDRKTGAIQGFEESVKNYEMVADVEALTEDEGFSAMETILQAHPDIDAVLATNESSALGAMAAIEAAGLKPGVDVIISISGNSQRVIEGILAGKLPGGPYADSVVWGGATADTIFKLVRGEKLEAQIGLPLSLITAENAQETLDRYYGEPAATPEATAAQ
jgi:ABC-type sugar transport system substrate-binding protein